MKTTKHLTAMAFIAIITLAFVTCKDEPEHTHVWGEWVQIKAPTETEEGEETRTCATCGETETRPIAKRTPIVDEVWVEGGSFQMGKELGTATNASGNPYSDVTPVHTVTVSGFYIGKYEVTQKQWQTVMGTTLAEQNALSDYPAIYGEGDNYPMYQVSWYDAVEFCNKLSQKEGLTPYYTIDKTVGSDTNNTNEYDTLKWTVTRNETANGYRLPTEAQWEYAAKGGNTGETYTYSGSDDPNVVAWYSGNNGASGTAEYGSKAVGTKAANGLGLHDMSGNVWEWCWDWWYGAYADESQTNPVGASSGSGRVVRGGGWLFSAEYVRSANRIIGGPRYRGDVIGFRLVRP